MKKWLVLTMVVLGFASAEAQTAPRLSYQNVSGSFHISGSDTVQTVRLSGWKYVENLQIQAEGIRSDAIFDVVTNGVVKGTIYVPGRDPNYTVTIRETIESIQFIHRSGGTARIIGVQGSMSDVVSKYKSPTGKSSLSWMALNKATELAARTIALTESVEHFVDYKTYGEFLLPIKKAAARLYAIASANGDLSAKTIKGLEALNAQIDAALTLVEQALSQNATFGLATELLTVQEEIKDILK